MRGLAAIAGPFGISSNSVSGFADELDATLAALSAQPEAQAVPVAWIRTAMLETQTGEVDYLVRVGTDQQHPDDVPLYRTPPAKVPEGARLWLWRHHDHFLAFTHQYPCFTPGGDPMTLGPPVGYAVFRVSHDRAAALTPATPQGGE